MDDVLVWLSTTRTGGSVTTNGNNVAVTAPGGTKIRTNDTAGTVSVNAPGVRTNSNNGNNRELDTITLPGKRWDGMHGSPMSEGNQSQLLLRRYIPLNQKSPLPPRLGLFLIHR